MPDFRIADTAERSARGRAAVQADLNHRQPEAS
jgi:hypothetical protein